jgi:hypothetical protein
MLSAFGRLSAMECDDHARAKRLQDLQVSCLRAGAYCEYRCSSAADGVSMPAESPTSAKADGP